MDDLFTNDQAQTDDHEIFDIIEEIRDLKEELHKAKKKKKKQKNSKRGKKNKRRKKTKKLNRKIEKIEDRLEKLDLLLQTIAHKQPRKISEIVINSLPHLLSITAPIILNRILPLSPNYKNFYLPHGKDGGKNG